MVVLNWCAGLMMSLHTSRHIYAVDWFGCHHQRIAVQCRPSGPRKFARCKTFQDGRERTRLAQKLPIHRSHKPLCRFAFPTKHSPYYYHSSNILSNIRTCYFCLVSDCLKGYLLTHHERELEALLHEEDEEDYYSITVE
jgi:hypothetical protein